MLKAKIPQRTFFNMMYDRIIPENHFLKRLSNVIEFSFIDKECKALYCQDNGRRAYLPSQMFKIVFLEFYYNISDREVEEQVHLNMAYKWFVGLEPEDKAPDHSTLSRFRDRLGADKFIAIFNRIVETAQDKGLITDRLQIIDSTHIEARVDLFRLKKEHKKEEFDKTYVDRQSPDRDASFGHKTKNKIFYGYKAHCSMDADSLIITDCITTPGNEPDGDKLPQLIRGSPKDVTADKSYDSNDNHNELRDRGIHSSIILKDNRVDPEILNLVNIESQKERPKIEPKFSEEKNRHGMKKCRYWGLLKTKIQVLMCCIVVNLKRIVKLVSLAIKDSQEFELKAA